MTPLILLTALMVGHATAVVQLSCSDNATCIDHMAKDLFRNLRQQRSVKLFDTLTIEPLGRRQARSNESPLSRFLNNHAFSFDWADLTFRVAKPEARSDVLDLEVFEGRSAAKDIPEPTAVKGSSTKVEEEEPINNKGHKIGLRRRHKKKVLMAVIPLLFGMKSAGAVIFAMAIVTVLTLKAFVASKLALLVTVGMAVKRLYESYSSGVGLQNHPYLYSQYPIDFPSASSHAYSVSGVSPQFGSPEMFNPTALGTHPHAHELLQPNDVSAQSSQQAPTLLVNSTRAAERWDGKSKLLKFFEPVIEGIKNFVDPIANVFYSMPASFRGMSSDVQTTKSYEPEMAESKKPKEILVPQPRLIAQRKMTYRKNVRTRPKKYTELKVNLERLKQNKDLHDYMKTKKYKYNYPHTYYYPRVKYFVNPNIFRPNNSRLIPYKIEKMQSNEFVAKDLLSADSNEWRPIVVYTSENKLNGTKEHKRNKVKKNPKNNKSKSRVKRSVNNNYDLPFRNSSNESRSIAVSGRGFFDMLSLIIDSETINSFVEKANAYAKTVMKEDTKEKPMYYSVAYKIIIWGLDMLNEMFNSD